MTCPDLWDCIYEGKQAAQMVLNRRDELLKSFTKEDIAINTNCLDRELEITPGGLALYLERTDGKGHIYTATHKYMIELHATHRANLDLALDYIFNKYPDIVIALYSDHGQASSLADQEWTSHGYQTPGNTGFLILLHRSFAGKTKKNPDIPEDSASMFLQFLSLLRGANFPMYSEDIPVAKFADDPDDRLRVLRLKEMQLQSLLGAEHFADSPLLSFLDSGLSLTDNIARTDKSRMKSFLAEYERYLRKKHPLYMQKLNSLLHSSFLAVQIGGLILGLATVVLLPFLVRRLLQGKERVAVLVAFGMVLAWTGVKIMIITEKGWYDTYISLSFLIPLTLFFRYLASLTPDSQSVLGRVAKQLPARDWQYLYWIVGMWTGVIIGVKLVFVVVMDWTHTSRTFLYFLSKPAGVMSAMVITLWTVVLVWMAWTSDSYDQTDNISDKDEIDSSVKLRLQKFIIKSTRGWRQIIITLYRLALTYIAWRLYKCIATYEWRIYESNSLENTAPQIETMVEFYTLVIFALVLFFLSVDKFTKIMCICYFYLNTSMLENHLSRLTYGLFVLPAMVYLYKDRMRRRKEVGYDGWSDILVETILVIVQFGLYTANGESHAFKVNQRAMIRQPTNEPGNNMNIEVPLTINIKINTLFLYNLFIIQIHNSKQYYCSMIVVTFFCSCSLVECYFRSLSSFHFISFFPLIALTAGPPVVRFIQTGFNNLFQALWSLTIGKLFKQKEGKLTSYLRRSEHKRN
jgi:hypothetical protein